LADIDLATLCELLSGKEIVLHGADYDLRLLRRNLNFVPKKVFDTAIAARILGIREFSLAALVKRSFEIELVKGSQKANWAQRPISKKMAEYAINDTRYLLPLAERLEKELESRGRMDWFRQSCQRALEIAAIDRERDVDEAWRVSGAGALRGRASAVLRELWNWREKEAEAADRPPFHVLQNRELIHSAERFAHGETPDYKHFSGRRRRGFREAAGRGLNLPEKDWPVSPKWSGTRPTAEMIKRTEKLRHHRDHAAEELHIESSFIAPRATLEAIAADQSRADGLLVPWQRELLKL
jgi:ribonuclease D